MNIRRNYIFLLCGLIAYLMLSPALRTALGDDSASVNLLLPLCFALGVASLVGQRLLLRLGGALVVAAMLLEGWATASANAAPHHAALMLMLLYCALFGAVVLHDVLLGGTLDVNRLFGAVSVYLFIGIAWSILYALVDAYAASPAFRGIEAKDEYVYFSFVTLTTLGFGDIVPLTRLARTLVYMEAVLGQLYLTILIAALVGRLVGAAPPRHTTPEDRHP